MAHVVKCDLCSFVDDGHRRIFHVMPRVISAEDKRRVTSCLPGVDVCQKCLPPELWQAIMDASTKIEAQLKEMIPGAPTERLAP